MIKNKRAIFAAIISIMALAGNSNAEGQDLTCALPPSVKEHTPLLGLDPRDKATQQLAREHIEYERRRPFNEGSWSLASTMVLTKQMELARVIGLMEGDREKIQSWKSAEERTGTQLFDQPLENVIDSQAQQFKQTCTHYIQINRFLTEREKSLEKLRKEKKQPWLSPERKLPCDILNVSGCAA